MSDAADISREDWTADLARIGAERGFFRQLGDASSALYVENGKTLVVTFENMDMIFKSDDRMPWGFDFILAQGWSIMGLMAHGWTWYRDGAVDAFFRRIGGDRVFRSVRPGGLLRRVDGRLRGVCVFPAPAPARR